VLQALALGSLFGFHARSFRVPFFLQPRRLREHRGIDIGNDLTIDLLTSRLKHLLGFGQPLACRQQEVRVPVVQEPSVRVRLDARAGLQKAPVRIHDVSGARPSAQQRFMCHADNSIPFGILVADEEPCRDQRVNESCPRRRCGKAGKRGRARCDALVSQPYCRQATQHRGQRVLGFWWKRVDYFIGASRNHTFETTQRPIRGKGEQSLLPAGLVKRIKHELQKRQRSGIGSCSLLQNIVQPALIGVLLEPQAGRARRLADDLGDFCAGRRQQLIAAKTVLQRRKTRDLTASKIEI
jgi:hypothetical protein